MVNWFKSLGVCITEVFFCMENTGIYHRALANFLLAQNCKVWVESGAEIKWSMGIQRGKNDKVDSRRIMTYAIRNKDKAKLYIERSPELQKVSDLLA